MKCSRHFILFITPNSPRDVLIEPFLEEHEEAVGFEISLKHIAPTRIGETVEMIAALTKMDGKRVTCTIEARNQKGKICEGTQTQILIRKGELY